MSSKIIKKIGFAHKSMILVDEKMLESGALAGKSVICESEDNIVPSSDNLTIRYVTHVIKKFTCIADPTLSVPYKCYVEIQFLDTNKANNSFELFESIENGQRDAKIRAIPHIMGGTLVRLDIGYICSPDNPDTFLHKEKLDMKEMIIKEFSEIKDDKEAIKLCQKYNHMVEVMIDSSESWVQWNNGTEEEDILYDFNEYFGHADGVHNLFKVLNIISKPV